MTRSLDSLVDKGCWISHDRIYAFVSSEHGITEIGYHGTQPVSKNSRVLVNESGVLTFSVRIGKNEHRLQMSEVEWHPTRMESTAVLPEGIFSLKIIASGRSLKVRCSWSGSAPATFFLQFSKKSPFTEVHGERTWSPFRTENGMVFSSFRDRIMLGQWLQRTGPYAGDFLIPETIRKKIFNSRKRSGLATRNDLRPEFRNSDVTLYDSECFLALGGEGFSLSESAGAWTFERILPEARESEILLQWSDRAMAGVPAEREPTVGPFLSRFTCPGFPHLEEFVATVPGLVESCIVRDYGIPRACPGRYYWIWAWDALVTMQEALRWGDVPHVASTIQFIEKNRDESGRIPARWTRSLVPLDTPSPGGIEFLQAALVYETFLETNDAALLKESLPSFRALFEAYEQQLLSKGVVTGEGFYPDLLSAFGRTETSAVCMETGSWYAFCRILENIARQAGDGDLEARTEAAATAAMERFSATYWDKETGFVVDSIDTQSGRRSRYHPLFALLFLQSSLGLPLLRPHIPEAAAFIDRQLATDTAMRVIPPAETGPSGEEILRSWYPHWDFYALKILRRAGNAGAIMRWLKQAEEALSRLGYCPEFIALLKDGDSEIWKHHGSASNLNCVTSWYRSLRECLIGFESDPGGITHIPLSLPVALARMEGIHWRGGIWTFESMYNGPHFESLSIDGTIVEGCLKIPSTFSSGGSHTVTARYGNKAMLPAFTEFTNARVMKTKRLSDAVEVEVDPMGFTEGAAFSPDEPRILVDGRMAPVQWDRATGMAWFSLSTRSACTIRMERK